MNDLFRFPTASKRHPDVEQWVRDHPGELCEIALRWLDVMRRCGSDIRELIHDGYPTVCVDDAAFAYVGAFRAHVNVGFFRGAELPDPDALLEGSGKRMRHVKIRPGTDVDSAALERLIDAAYRDMRRRLDS